MSKKFIFPPLNPDRLNACGVEMVARVYDLDALLTNQICPPTVYPKKYTGPGISREDEERIFLSRSRQEIPTRNLLTRDDLEEQMQDFKNEVVPRIVIPELGKRLTPQKLEELLYTAHNKKKLHSLLGKGEIDFEPAQHLVAELTQVLAKYYPKHPHLKPYYTTAAKKKMSADSDNARNFAQQFANLVLEQPEFAGLKGQKKLTHLLNEADCRIRRTHLETHASSYADATPFTAPQLARIVSGQLGSRDGITINRGEFYKARDQAIHVMKELVLEQFRENIQAVSTHVGVAEEKFAKANIPTQNYRDMPLPQIKAGKKVRDALHKLRLDTPGGQMISLSLAHRPSILMASSNDVAAFRMELSLADVGADKEGEAIEKKAAQGGIAGYSESNKDTVMVYDADPRETGRVLAHELIHNGFRNLYRNTGSQVYPPDPDLAAIKEKTIAEIEKYNPRRALFIEALRSDLNAIGRDMDTFRQDFNRSRAVYSGADMHAEILTVILERMAMGQWTPEMAHKYKHLTRLVETIVGNDLDAWHKACAAGKPFNVETDVPIDLDAYRSGLPPVTQRQPITFLVNQDCTFHGAPVMVMTSAADSWETRLEKTRGESQREIG